MGEFGNNPNEYDRVHGPRWNLSLEWIEQNVPLNKDSLVLEVAGESTFTKLFQDKFNLTPERTNGDVRGGFGWHERYDLVINMEVIEHLSDVPKPGATLDEIGTFTKSGPRSCLLNCFNTLKPGGYLFLTTPNSSSINCLAQWVGHTEVMLWSPHVREYSFNEAVALVAEPGFEIVKSGTGDPYDHTRDAEKIAYLTRLRACLMTLKAPMENRGDLTFILAKKKG